MEWKTIETAPKDRAILGYFSLTEKLWVIVPCYFDNAWLEVQYYCDNTEHKIYPTHWMEIPEPPEQLETLKG